MIKVQSFVMALDFFAGCVGGENSFNHLHADKVQLRTFVLHQRANAQNVTVFNIPTLSASTVAMIQDQH